MRQLQPIEVADPANSRQSFRRVHPARAAVGTDVIADIRNFGITEMVLRKTNALIAKQEA